MRPPAEGGVTSRRALAALDAALVLAATARAAVTLQRAPRWTVDDAFIVARYADNLAHHGVLAWNLDGPRVEGFTSPLMALAGALASALGVGAIRAMTALGVGAYLASGALLWGLAREIRAPAPAGGLCALVYLGVAEHVRHAGSALETEVYLAVEIAAAWAFARALRAPGRAAPLFALGAIACLVRPEGAALAAVLAGLVAVRAGWSRAHRRERLVALAKRAAVWLVAPLAVVITLRFLYFHAVLPNTYYAKRGAWNALHARDLAALGRIYLLDPLLLAAGAATLPGLLGARSRRLGPRAIALLVACGAILAAYALAYARADLVMNYGRRFAMHGLPWLAIALLVLAARGADRVRRLGRAPAAWLLAACAALVAATGPFNTAVNLEEQTVMMARYEETQRARYAPLAAYLAAHVPRTATLAVYPDAGLVPFTTGLPSIDFGRLCDGYLAREARSPSDVAAYFFARRPDAAVFYLTGAASGYDAGADAILRDPAFAASYTRALAVVNAHGSGTALYLRKP